MSGLTLAICLLTPCALTLSEVTWWNQTLANTSQWGTSPRSMEKYYPWSKEKHFLRLTRRHCGTKFRPCCSSCSRGSVLAEGADDITSSPTVTYTPMWSSANWGKSLPAVRRLTLKPRHRVVPELRQTATGDLLKSDS